MAMGLGPNPDRIAPGAATGPASPVLKLAPGSLVWDPDDTDRPRAPMPAENTIPGRAPTAPLLLCTEPDGGAAAAGAAAASMSMTISLGLLDLRRERYGLGASSTRDRLEWSDTLSGNTVRTTGPSAPLRRTWGTRASGEAA